VFRTTAFAGSSSERNARASRTKVTIAISPIVAVDRRDEVPVLGVDAADADVGTERVRGATDAIERRARVAAGEDVDQCRAAAAPGRAGRCGRALHARDVRDAARDTGRIRLAREDLDRCDRSRPDSGALQRGQTVPGVAAQADRVRIAGRCAEVQRRGGYEQRGQDGQRGRGSGPALTDDESRPAGPGAAGAVVRANVRPVEPASDRGEDHGQQRRRDEHADQRDQHSAVADAAQIGQRQRDERQEPDCDRGAAEHDCAAGGLHRPHDRLVAVGAVGAFLAPADDDEQRVVDGHAQADERDQEGHDLGHLSHRRQRPDEQEAGHDRDQRDQERHDGEKGGEHEGEHEQSADSPEGRLGEQAETAALPRRDREGVEAGQVHGRSRDRDAVQGVAGRLRRLGVLTEAAEAERWVGDEEVVRPSAETKARLPVDAYEAMRAWGRARSTRVATACNPACTAAESTLVPGGSVATATSGARLPPVP
jgi:hypothetical protein